MKIFANHEKKSTTVNQMEGIFLIIYNNQNRSDVTKDGRYTVLM